jgi:hypothetical protein
MRFEPWKRPTRIVSPGNRAEDAWQRYGQNNHASAMQSRPGGIGLVPSQASCQGRRDDADRGIEFIETEGDRPGIRFQRVP